MLDEEEFLSPYGIRSLSKKYGDHPFSMEAFGDSLSVSYVPGESKTHMFGGQSLSGINPTLFIGSCPTAGHITGNSNWRGPIWLCGQFIVAGCPLFPPPPLSLPHNPILTIVNYLIIESLERLHFFYGDDLKVRCPTNGGEEMNLQQVSKELSRRLVSLFEPDADGHRPCHGGAERYAKDPHWKDLLLFHEYFHGDTGRGCGAR